MLLKFWIFTGIVAILLLGFIWVEKSGNKKNKKIVQSFNNIYNLLSKIPFINNKLNSIKIKIYNNSLTEEWVIKYKVILYLIISWLIGIASAAFVIIYFRNNLYVTCTLLFFSFQIKNIVLDFFIGDDTNFLIGIYNYNIELQQSFSSTKDIMNSIDEANLNSTNYSLVKRMEDVLKILDDEPALDEYLNDCPNEYLKLLVLSLSLTNEYGDKKDIENRSVFLENLFYINELIETEVFKRRQLKFWLKGLPFLCIAPLLSFTPFEVWAHKKLPMTDAFYGTSLGFITKIVITAICIACFYLIKNFADTNRRKTVKVKNSYWEEQFFRNKLIKKFMKIITPKYNSRRAYKYRDLIGKSGEYTRIEYIYLRKIIFATTGFIIMLSLSFSIHNLNKYNIIENQTNKFKNEIIVANGEQIYSKNLERELINFADLSNVPKSYEIISNKIKDFGVTENIDQLTKKIIEKKVYISNETLRWYDFMISILVAILLYHLPEVILRVKAKLRKEEMENEIRIFETIILILMYHENATSELILDKMSQFADIFKQQVDIALKEIKKSDSEALELFVQELKYKPFITLIKNIIKAENIKTKEAFISLADNRRNYLMNRKEEDRRLVYKRVSRSSLISLIPINLIIMAYIAGPMLYVAFIQLDASQNQFMDLQNTRTIENKMK